MHQRFRFFTVLMLVVVMFFSFSSGAFAATVGQQLNAPENGWKRYDEVTSIDSFVTEGTWYIGNDPGNYGGTLYTSNSINASLQFEFYGTKLRLIAPRWPSHTDSVKVFVDDVQAGSWNAKGAFQHMTLFYEVSGLSMGKHTVKVVKDSPDTSYFSLDAFDIDEDGYLVGPVNAAKNLIALSDISKVNLTWSGVAEANSYNVKRATNPSGPYTVIATGVTGETYSDLNVTNGITYYYVVTAVNSSGESANSNEASATPQGPVIQPETGRAILTITMDTGLEKEFDLSMAEVNSFITWYEGKAAGSGTASYAIDKHDNNKGPFKNRKDYVIFDKILTFEVNEYEVNE